MTATDPRWLVTINGRVPTDHDMAQLHQGDLGVYLCCHGERGAWYRSEFAREVNARTFYKDASREFPEDDVCLWTSVDTTTSER